MTFLMAAPTGGADAVVMNDSSTLCLVCQTGSDRAPLIALEYRGGTFRICPQHLPILIHNPSALVGLIEGAEDFQPSAHVD